ncbi:replication initiation protein, partial [Klebsiella pneumoniae]|nr:replication initiation protein [Klebsiella pneumoniae]
MEANPLVLRSITVIDQDTSDSDWAADLAGLPSPTWVAMNPHTTAGHIAYGLQSPVCLSDAAHRRPVRLLA